MNAEAWFDHFLRRRRVDAVIAVARRRAGAESAAAFRTHRAFKHRRTARLIRNFTRALEVMPEHLVRWADVRATTSSIVVAVRLCGSPSSVDLPVLWGRETTATPGRGVGVFLSHSRPRSICPHSPVAYHGAMHARSALSYVTVALPPLVLAAIGVTHPIHLTEASAEYWRNLHIAILPIFPLLAFAPWILVRGAGLLLGWVVGVFGFFYAAFYTALDVLAGIGAGGLASDGMGMATSTVFGLGSHLGEVGSVAFIVAVVVSAGSCIVRFHTAALPGSILVSAGAILFLNAHIYFPVGVVGQLCLALGWTWLYFVVERAARAHATLDLRSVDSATQPR